MHVYVKTLETLKTMMHLKEITVDTIQAARCQNIYCFNRPNSTRIGVQSNNLLAYRN